MLFRSERSKERKEGEERRKKRGRGEKEETGVEIERIGDIVISIIHKISWTFIKISRTFIKISRTFVLVTNFYSKVCFIFDLIP